MHEHRLLHCSQWRRTRSFQFVMQRALVGRVPHFSSRAVAIDADALRFKAGKFSQGDSVNV